MTVSDEAARRVAQEILAADEYTRWNADYDAWLRLLERLGELVPDWLVAAISHLQDILSSLFRGLGRVLDVFGVLGDVTPLVGWIAVCIVMTTAIALYWQWQARRQVDAGAHGRERGPGSLHAEAMREARACAQQGHYLEAAHRIQLATLAMLIEFDWLELARSDPNRTLRQRVSESALPDRERRELVALVDRLEALWFDEPIEDQGLYEDWVSLDARLASLAPSGGGA